VDTKKREKILLREMKPWLKKGYMSQSVTESNAYLVKQRKINWWWLLAWSVIIPVIGFAFYVLYVYYRDLKTVSITVDYDGKVWVQMSRTR
jgi:hypothetical protein